MLRPGQVAGWPPVPGRPSRHASQGLLEKPPARPCPLPLGPRRHTRASFRMPLPCDQDRVPAQWGSHQCRTRVYHSHRRSTEDVHRRSAHGWQNQPFTSVETVCGHSTRAEHVRESWRSSRVTGRHNSLGKKTGYSIGRISSLPSMHTWPRPTLLVKSRRSISQAIGVNVTRGRYSVSMAFKRRMQDRFSARF